MFKQPRIPEYRESEGTGKYLRSLVLFLKDFCMDCWVSVRELQKGGGGLLRALTSDPREDGGEPEAPDLPEEEEPSGVAIYREVIDYIYPIGRTITTLSDDDNPNTLYPWQTWEKTAKGRMIIGTGANAANTTTEYGSLEAGTVNRILGEMGGEAAHPLMVDEIPNHAHRAMSSPGSGTGVWFPSWSGKWSGSVAGTPEEGYGALTEGTGGDQPHNNMPPYIAANIWKRVR